MIRIIIVFAVCYFIYRLYKASVKKTDEYQPLSKGRYNPKINNEPYSGITNESKRNTIAINIDEIIENAAEKVKSNWSSNVDRSIIDVSGESEIIDYSNNSTEYDYSNWGLGGKYKKELGLSKEDVQKLNALIDTSNKFNTIEYCSLNLVKMFLAALKDIEAGFSMDSTSFEAEALIVADIEISKRFKYRRNSNNYKNQVSFYRSTINQLIYKICENALRDRLYAGRKTDLKYYIFTDEGYAAFNDRFLPHIERSIERYFDTIESISLGDEQSLNVYSRARWKQILNEMENELLPKSVNVYYENVIKLGLENEKNPAVENIFFMASKTLAKHDKILSLKLFVYYVYYDLISEYFDNKQLTKTVQKSLFKTDEHQILFEALINDYVKDRDLDKALNAVDHIFIAKRKKIKLNRDRIEEVEGKHSDTVEILNELLQEDEDINVSNAEIALNISLPEVVGNSIFDYNKDISLSSVQKSFIELFPQRGFVIAIDEAERFANENGVFKNALLDDINDACYEVVDDLLIEEDDENVYLNEMYYKLIVV